MCNNFPNIKVVEGNAFSVLVPLKVRTFESCRPIDEDIDPTKLSNVVFKFGGVSYTPIVDERGVAAVLPATLARGTYDIVVTADYEDNPIRAAYEGAITIVPWNSQSDAQQYLPGSPIVLDAAYIIGGALTDAELEALKEELRLKIADAEAAEAAAEAAKEHYDELAEQLSGVAQEQTLTDGVTAIREDISHIDIDTSALAKQGTNPNATLTDTEAAVKDGNDTTIGMLKDATNGLVAIKTQAANAANDAAAAKTAAQGITGYALQGSDATATNTSIAALIGYTISEIDGI